jgi:hypothetical protein
MHRLGGVCLCAFLLAGCVNTSPWRLDAIATGNQAFDSARLVYRDPASSSPIRLEYLRIGTAVELFLNLNQFTIDPSPDDRSSAQVRLTIGDESPFEEKVPLLEGNMRLRFSEETASRITRALQEGKKVAILVDGFEEIFQPEWFSKRFEQLTGNSIFFQNPLKGPIQ